MTRRLAAGTLAALAMLPASVPAGAQSLPHITPLYSIWDVEIGAPVGQIPAGSVRDISCGTNGGPPSRRLRDVFAFAECPAEVSGLHEVYFAYDDESDYIAKALEVEYKALQGGTSAYAHPVIVSVLVDAGGTVRGIRIVTDDRASLRERRTSVNLARNLKARFGSWELDCREVPLRPGEKPVGTQFIHEACTGESDEAGQRLFIEAYYYRKRGQEAVNRETQEINKGYFSSGTRFELVQLPYQPSVADAS